MKENVTNVSKKKRRRKYQTKSCEFKSNVIG